MKGVLVNIFGGIMKCDVIAEGVVAAADDELGFSVPLVVRLEGTNVEEGKKLLERDAACKIITGAATSTTRPQKVVAARRAGE